MQIFCSDYIKGISFLTSFSPSLVEGSSSFLSLQDTFCDAKLVKFIPVGRNCSVLLTADVGGIFISAVAEIWLPCLLFCFISFWGFFGFVLIGCLVGICFEVRVFLIFLWLLVWFGLIFLVLFLRDFGGGLVLFDGVGFF